MNVRISTFLLTTFNSLPYLNAVIDETLRLDPISVNGMERRAEHDIVLGGEFVVPKGVSI